MTKRAPKKHVYRSIREGSTVKNVYLGPSADPVVRVMLRHDEVERAFVSADDGLVRRELEISDCVDRCLHLVAIAANRIVRNLRKRMRRALTGRVRRDVLQPSPTTDISRERYDELVAAAATGNEEALAQLRSILHATPDLYQVLGDLNDHVQRQLIALAAADSVDVRESLKIVIAEQREQLLAEGDTLPERMLVEQVLSTMLDVAVQRIALAQPHRKQSIFRHLERRLHRALERHLTAVKALVEVRQMLID